jgi:drug/metabolite transporter (DMT)-like permease
MNNIKYIMMVLAGSCLYGTMSSMVKMLHGKGYTAAEISYWQALIAALLLGLAALATRRHAVNINKMKKKDLWPLLLTGSAIGLVNYLYYLSVSYIPASIAVIILMQFTWFSLLLEWLIFGRKPSRIEFATMATILTGTLLAGGLLETDLCSMSAKGLLTATGAAMAYAVYVVANGRIGKGVRWQSKSATIMLGSSLTILAINGSAAIGLDNFSTEFASWAMMLAIAGTTIPTALFAMGIYKIGACTSSVLMTAELPVAIISAHLILGEKTSNTQIAGIIILIGAISAMNYYRTNKHRI